MKKDNKTKKNSAMKKLVPATGMLLVSAIMLTTATYAWFTMSREVEVQNIQMTATVPEDIQISLGKIGTNNTNASTEDGTSLANNTGVLVSTSDSVTPPRGGSDAYNAIDWSNTADISHYYKFGRLIPASSDTGANIFFTPDANGIGQTVKTDAKYYIAASGTSAQGESGIGGSTSSGTFKATSHVKVSGETGAWAGSGTGTRATAWNSTNDDGYYIDIPVWLRTSSTAGANVKVKAYVVDRNTITGVGTDTSGTTTNRELYRAVRVAILKGNGTAAAASGGNLVPVADGDGVLSGANTGYAGAPILDWYGNKNTSGTNPSVSHAGAVQSATNGGDATYNSNPVAYDGSSAVAALDAGTGNAYGPSKQVWIRVWLEGNDPDCYNETAGQDWSINLKFEKITT